MQQLPDGDVFIGWGNRPFFSEYSSAGQQLFDAHFDQAIANYRAYRFAWTAQPLTLPSLAVSAVRHGTVRIYASWNGATDVSSWRVLMGMKPRGLSAVMTVPKAGFETAITVVSTATHVAVEALGAGGQVLSRSRTIAVRARLAKSRHTSRRGHAPSR
jgi:hypothetical protein